MLWFGRGRRFRLGIIFIINLVFISLHWRLILSSIKLVRLGQYGIPDISWNWYLPHIIGERLLLLGLSWRCIPFIHQLGPQFLELFFAIFLFSLIAFPLSLFRCIHVDLHISWNRVRELKLEFILELKSFYLLLKIIKEVETLWKLYVSIQSMS